MVNTEVKIVVFHLSYIIRPLIGQNIEPGCPSKVSYSHGDTHVYCIGLPYYFGIDIIISIIFDMREQDCGTFYHIILNRVTH